MRLDWNDIKARAAKFAEDWNGAQYERGETQTFYNDFFQLFGVTRRRVASFEHGVNLPDKKRGYLDLFWKGKLLVEQKSAGRSLTPARRQALDGYQMRINPDYYSGGPHTAMTTKGTPGSRNDHLRVLPRSRSIEHFAKGIKLFPDLRETQS